MQGGGRGRVLACQVAIEWAMVGHLAMEALEMVHHEGVGLVLVSLELILGTRGCYDYHRRPYR